MFKFTSFMKPGKGVAKGEPEKKGIFRFFEIMFTHFGKMCKASMLYSPFLILPAIGLILTILELNLLYLFLCLPLLLAGPATAGFTLILRNFAKGTPVFVWSDFKQGFTENFKNAILTSIVTLLGVVLLPFPLYYYIMWFNDSSSWWLIIPISVLLTALLIFIFAHYYLYLMMTSMELKFKAVVKNSIIMAIAEMKTNFITLFFHALIIVPIVLFFPILYFPVLLFFFFFIGTSLMGFIVMFNSYNAFKRRILEPMLQQQEETAQPEEEEERIFSDQLIIKNDSENK